VIRAVRVGSATGLHARAAAIVAAAAAEETTAITVRRDGRPAVPADCVLALLTLAATRGTQLTLEAEDSAAAGRALDRVAALLAADLDAPASPARPSPPGPSRPTPAAATTDLPGVIRG
jgi:phosphocarrier protein HPr